MPYTLSFTSAPLSQQCITVLVCAMQNPQDLLCYSGLIAMGSLPAGTWLLGDAFLRNYYAVYDYGTPAVSAGPAAAEEGVQQEGQQAKPRVGLGRLNAAEQAAAAALFDQALASKRSSVLGIVTGTCAVLRLGIVAVISLWMLA
jgi:hypothetical protein